MTMGEVLRFLNELTHGDAIIATDVGQHQMVACRYAKFNHSKSCVTSGGLGTMGFGLPAAIGAWYGAPDKTVVAIVGDGGFQMTLQELGTIMQFGAKVKVLILNNGEPNDYLTNIVSDFEQEGKSLFDFSKEELYIDIK